MKKFSQHIFDLTFIRNVSQKRYFPKITTICLNLGDSSVSFSPMYLNVAVTLVLGHNTEILQM